jgi:hypothetical protein
MDIQILEHNYNTFNDYIIDFIAVYPHGDISHLPFILNKFNIQQIELLISHFFDNETLYMLLNINQEKIVYFIRTVADLITNKQYNQMQNFYQNNYFYQNNFLPKNTTNNNILDSDAPDYIPPDSNPPAFIPTTYIPTASNKTGSNQTAYIPPHKRNKRNK